MVGTVGESDARARRIVAAAQRLGFASCRFTSVAPVPHAAAVERWITEGRAASMAYIGRRLAERLDVRRIVPQARTVISITWRYTPPPQPPHDWRVELRGRIAAYAFGPDYHDVLAPQLEALAGVVRDVCPGAVTRAYVDTGPVLEREWAAAGGIGWFGRNTMVLNREHGSYFFLAEILTSAELPSDTPVADHCGTCTSCVDRCPTGALSPGYVLDARRCISYWTIEHRGSIPIERRAEIGNWVFGCDVCQEVCPWNEKLVRDHRPPGDEALLPFLPDLLALSPEGFAARFGRSAVRRAKRDGLARNAAVALGNSGNPAAVPALARALRQDAVAVVRAHAAWALGRIGGRAARRALDDACVQEDNDEVRTEVAAALAMS